MRIGFLNFNIMPTIQQHKQSYVQNPFVSVQPLKYDTFERQNVSFSASINSNFPIKDVKNMHCPACGLLMLDEEQIKAFVDDVSNKRGKALAYALEKYEDESVFTGEKSGARKSIYRPQKQQIVDILKEQAINNPNMNIVELVQLEAKNRIQDLIAQQLKVVDKLENFVNNSNIPSEQRMEINDVIANYKAQIKGDSTEQFSRKRFKYALSKIPINGGIQKNILNIADELPRSDNNIDSFFIKYSKVRKPQEIAKKFVFESRPTAEHLIPARDNGASNSKNYICDCSDCNSRRQDLEFKYWATGIDGFQQKLQNYLGEVDDAITRGELDPSYRDYIVNISKKIYELSEGKIDLRAPRKDVIKKQDNYPKRNRLVSAAKKKQKEDKQLLVDLTRQLEKLESDENFQVIREYYSSKADVKRLTGLVRKTSKNENSQRMISIQNALSKAQKRMNVLSFAFEHPSKLEKRISEYKANLVLMEEIQSKIDKNSVQIQREEQVKKTLEEVNTNISRLEAVDKDLLSKKDFNPNYMDDFNEYLRLKSLLGLSNKMKDKSLYRKLKDNKDSRMDRSDDAKLIIEIAAKSISASIDELLKRDSVVYFINKDELEKNINSKRMLENEYEAIQQKKELIVQMNEQLSKIGKDKTYAQVKYEYSELKRKLQTTVAIKNINQLRTEIDTLKDKIEYNRRILDSLSDPDSMSNEEFESKLAMLYQ